MAATVDRWGVPVHVIVKPGVSTVAELSIVDPTGARTYFYQRTPELLATLDEADLTLLDSTAYLYVDWYDGDHIFRPIKAASRLGVPVFINIESENGNRELLAELARYTTICQVSANERSLAADSASTADGLLANGIESVVVTEGYRGSRVADASQTVRVSAPQVDVMDGNGAGSCFSAGFIYGRRAGMGLRKMRPLRHGPSKPKMRRFRIRSAYRG